MFYIVGSRPVAEVQALANEQNIVVTGTVPDTRPYLAHAEIAVAPLRIARGIQNKVLEGMAMARPTVVTPAALEGIDAVPREELLLAADANAFADQVLAAISRPDSARMGAAARRRVVADFDWDRNLAGFRYLLEGDKR